MAGSGPSKDTQEEKSQPRSIEDRYGTTAAIPEPGCAQGGTSLSGENEEKLRKKTTPKPLRDPSPNLGSPSPQSPHFICCRRKREKDPKGNVMLKCTEVPKDEGPGEPEEQPSCSRSNCTSEPTQQDCSAINSMQTYHPVQCPREGQARGATWEEEAQPGTSVCWSTCSSNDGEYMELCCPPEVLKSQDSGESEEKLLTMTDSKDTQEEKPQPRSLKRRYETMEQPCLKLDVPREKKRCKSNEDPKDNVVLSCMKVPKDEGPGEPEEQPSCSRSNCTSEPTQQDCSAINSMQTYHPVQCPREGQARGATWEEEAQPGTSVCWAQSTEDPENIDWCWLPDVMENVTLEEIEKILATENQQLSAMDHQEAIHDHQTPKTSRDHQTSPRTSRRFQELPTSGFPTPTHTPLCLGTTLDHQRPSLGQQSSQGWVTAMGARAPGFWEYLGSMLVRRWRGQRGRGGQRSRG